MLPVFIMLLLAIGCTQKINLVDPYGRPLPDPAYRAQDLSGSELNCIFYFIKYESKIDKDGTKISKPTYLNWHKKHAFNVGDEVQMVVEMHNPNAIEYIIFDRIAASVKMGVFKDSIGKSVRHGYSNQDFRVFQFVIPTNIKAEFIVFSIDVTNPEGDPLFRVGNFKYSVE